jgi:hypothetical protein
MRFSVCRGAHSIKIGQFYSQIKNPKHLLQVITFFVKMPANPIFTPYA